MKTAIGAAIFAVMLVLILSFSFATSRQAFATSGTELSAIVAAAMKGTAVPGASALVIRNGKIDAVTVRGVRELGQAESVQRDDLWQIGSDTKPMTATLIIRLVEQHRLSLAAPLSALLPKLAAKARPEYRGITLRELLLHTAGLPHDISHLSVVAKFVGDKRPLPAQRTAYLEMALKEAPVAPPGKEFHYSNTGYILAGAIAEKATGISYEELMQREIFEPLHMTRVRFGLPPRNRGHLEGRVATPADELPQMYDPAGGVSISLADLAKFCIDQIGGAQGHGRVLTPEGYRLLQTPTAVTGSGFGLGWAFKRTLAGRQGPMLIFEGSDGSWFTLVGLFPASGNGLLVAANAGADMGGERSSRRRSQLCFRASRRSRNSKPELIYVRSCAILTAKGQPAYVISLPLVLLKFDASWITRSRQRISGVP